MPRAIRGLPVTGGGVTWNPSDKDGNIVLTNGNLTADGVGGGFNSAMVRATKPINGRNYWEVRLTDGGSNLYQAVGIANGTVTTATYPNTADSTDFFGIQQNQASAPWDWIEDWTGNYDYVVDADGIFRIAVDSVAKRLWWTASSEDWMPSGDPASGTGGYDISTITGTWYPIAALPGAGTTLTGQFSSKSWAYPAPNGFTEIGDTGPTRARVPRIYAPPTAATLNPADVSGSPTLSNGNRTIASDTDGGWNYSRSTSGSSVPFYFEFLVAASAGNTMAFVTNGTQDLATMLDVDPNDGIGIYGDGNWYSDNVPAYDAFSGTSGGAGDRVCVAVDPVNLRVWARLNNGNWNNSGTANPATNTGGKSIADFGGPLFAGAGSNYSYITTTIYFSSNDWVYNEPAGFIALFDPPASAENIWFQQTAFQIWPVVSSGTTYNEDVGETFALTDAFGGVAAFLRAITESAALTDAFGGTAVFPRPVAETIATSDAYTGTAAFVRAITESVATSDAFTGTMAATGAIAESVALTDAPAATLTLSAAIAETMGATDAPSASLTMLGAIAESVALTDAPNATAVFNRIIGESVALTDAQTGNIAIAAAIAESMAATDAFAGGLLFVVAVDESIALTDAQTGLLVMLCERAEIMSISDAQSATASFVVGITESVATADSVNAALSAIGALAETIATSDAYTGGSVYAMTVNESIGIADSQSVLVTLVGSVAEAIALADTAGTTLVAVAQVAETIATSDAYNEDGPPPPGTDEYRVGGGSVQELLQTLTVSTIHHTQKKTGPS